MFAIKIDIMNTGIIDIIEKVTEIFKTFLKRGDYRQTPERFAILKEIYHKDSHFTIEELYEDMLNKKFRISRATVYNTIKLLLKSNLVVKHQFDDNSAHFEKTFKTKQHGHMICTICKKVIEFQDTELYHIQKGVEKNFGFEVHSTTLTFYGLCKDCLKN